MKNQKGSTNSKVTIISIIILDIILMTLFLYFSDLILKDFKSSTNLSTIIISSFALVVPGTLIILIIIQFYNLYKSRFQPGHSFKTNIILYFILAILLVIIPQSFISINLINAATDNWLNNQVKKSVDIGFNMAINLENQRRSDLENLAQNTLFLSVIKDSYNKKNITIKELTGLNSIIDSVEYFDSRGKQLHFIGNIRLQRTTIDINKINNFYPKLKVSGMEVLSYQTQVNISSSTTIVVISHIMPKNFTENGSILTDVKNSIKETDATKKELSYGMMIFYGIFSIPLFLLAILGCFIFSDEIIKPLKDIEAAIRKVAQGNYSYRILSKKNNEFNILIRSFNNMIKEIEKSRTKLKHTEQISTWQDIATRLAHEIKNPLTPIKLSAQRVLLKEKDKELNKVTLKHMETIIKEVTRMEKLLNEFREFARFPKLNIETISIQETIKESVNSYSTTFPNITFDLNGIEDMDIPIDKNQMIQVISNLTINAIHAMENGGTIKYLTETVFKKGMEYCKLSIKDNGHGISKEIIPDLFKPYFTTKYSGSGLGLAIVNKIILDHKGKIWIESAENIGTTFYFELPKEAL